MVVIVQVSILNIFITTYKFLKHFFLHVNVILFLFILFICLKFFHFDLLRTFLSNRTNFHDEDFRSEVCINVRNFALAVNESSAAYYIRLYRNPWLGVTARGHCRYIHACIPSTSLPVAQMRSQTLRKRQEPWDQSKF